MVRADGKCRKRVKIAFDVQFRLCRVSFSDSAPKMLAY